MVAVVKSEFLKLKRTFSMKLTWIMPFVTIGLCAVLMAGRLLELGSYNWWYMLLLPGSISLFCTALVQKDSKMKYHGVLSLPIAPSKIWIGKVITGFLFLFLSCLIFFVGATIGGFLVGYSVPLVSSALAILVIFITFAWQVPLTMFLTTKIGVFGTILINVFANIGFSVFSVKSIIWMIPYATPARLMSPILKLHPNGIPLEAGDALLDSSVILPGILISICVCIVLTFLTTQHFKKQEAL